MLSVNRYGLPSSPGRVVVTAKAWRYVSALGFATVGEPCMVEETCISHVRGWVSYR
jgi:hypothetical protein